MERKTKRTEGPTLEQQWWHGKRKHSSSGYKNGNKASWLNTNKIKIKSKDITKILLKLTELSIGTKLD